VNVAPPEDTIRLRIRGMEKLRGVGVAPVLIQIPRLDLAPGEFVAIIGDNGSGKSTLLDLIGLILSPDRVEEFKLSCDKALVDIAGADDLARSRLRRRCLAYVLQTGGLLEFLTLRENIQLGARLAGKPAEHVDVITEELGISSVRNKRPGRVSGGQRQLAALARTLVQSPPLILADEPTASLHTHNATQVLVRFRDLARGARSSILMVTHDLSLAKTADRVLAFQPVDVGTGPLRSVLQTQPSAIRG
jgi:putative ABC transport system ATP-binding protein